MHDSTAGAGAGASVTVYEKHCAEAAAKAPGWNIVLGGVASKAIAAAGLSVDFPPHLECASAAPAPTPARCHARSRARAGTRPLRGAAVAAA